MDLTFVSLFSGFGGVDLGFERVGLRCLAQVEIEPAAQRVLADHFPGVPRFADVHTFKRSSLAQRPHIIVGGFPCQDISNAGCKVGIQGARSGLWGEMLRIIRAFKPCYVVVENVSALRSRGIDVVLRNLAQSGYDAEWDCLPAATVGAPHLRDRVFIVAYAQRLGWPRTAFFPALAPGQSGSWPSAKDSGAVEVVGRAHRRLPDHLRMDDGLPGRVERLRGCGNAVLPQLAEWLAQQLKAFHLQFIPENRARFARSARFSNPRQTSFETRINPDSKGLARPRPSTKEKRARAI